MLHRFFHFLKQSLLVVLCILLLGGLLAGGWFFYQGRQLYRSAASSYPVASMYDTICARGSYTSYDALPQIYINAVICTEDEHFMTHKGIDPGAIARALLADLRTHSLAEGGSTLTQQLAKNELFTQDKHLARKAAEMLAAFDIEKTYSKQQIFEIMWEQSRHGVSTIFVSSELEELRTTCDRIAIVSGGRIVGILPATESSETFGALMVSQVK